MSATNYNPDATVDDESCNYNNCVLPPQFDGNTGGNMTILFLNLLFPLFQLKMEMVI